MNGLGKMAEGNEIMEFMQIFLDDDNEFNNNELENINRR